MKPKIRIWSSASSTGQEPYTIAIMLKEYLINNNIRDIAPSDFRILGTDISTAVLGKAITGNYNEIEVARGLPGEFKNKYFRKEGTNWVIANEIREMVEFKQLNLIKPFTSLGTFEFILCRNVLIYFDDKTKIKILNQFYDMLTAQGFLMLGAMENTYCLSNQFHSLKIGKTILYQKI